MVDEETRSAVRNAWMSIAIFLSIFGNLLLILVISRRQRFHNVTNVYNLNLSFSDLVKVIFYIPVYLVAAEKKSWPYGLGGCQALNVILYTSFGVSVLTLMSLSFERYHLILHPTKKQMSVKNALITVSITWLASLTINLLMIPFLKLHPGPQGPICMFKTTKEWLISIITIMIFLSQLVPLIFFISTYALIIKKLRRDAKLVQPRELCSAARNRTRRNMRAVKILVIESTSWVFCIMPALVYYLIDALINGKAVSQNSVAYLIISCFLVLQTIVNPVVHFIFIKEFRNELRRIPNAFLKCFHCNQIEPSDYHDNAETTAGGGD